MTQPLHGPEKLLRRPETPLRRPARQGIERLREEVRRRVATEGLRPFAARTAIPLGRVRGLLDGRAALSSTIEAAASALGLEIYIGPPQGAAAADNPAAQAGKAEALLHEILSRLPPSSPPAAGELADAAAQAQPGMRDEAAEFPETRLVGVRELAAAAGGGAAEIDETVTGYVGFRRAWLERHALDPAQCSVIEVMGESMEPTLPENCSILVDHRRRRRLDGHIYVVRADGGLVVKRAVKDAGGWLMVSDHPSWPPAPWPPDAAVVGEVKWMARTL